MSKKPHFEQKPWFPAIVSSNELIDLCQLEGKSDNPLFSWFKVQSTWMFMPTGWKPNQRFACFYVFHGVNGVGWGGVKTFICTSSHIWCNAAVRLFALPHIHDATPLYVVLHFLTYMMLRYCTSSCTSSHIWCNAAVRRLALPHMHDATLLYVVLHFLTYMMLR